MREIVPEGTYPAKARPDTIQWARSSAGNEQLIMSFQIAEGEHTGDMVLWFATFTDRTSDRIFESLRSCGWTGDDLSDLGALAHEVEIVVEHSEWDGKTRARVAWVNAVGGGRIRVAKPLSPGEVKAFAKRMRPQVIGSAQPKSQASGNGGGRANNPPPPDDDDIPF